MKKSKLMQLCIVLMGMLIAVPSLAKDPHNFPLGYCTRFVATKTFIPFSGHAKDWLANAERTGFKVYRGNSKAHKYAVLATNEDARYGHVAWITDVKGDNIYVSEMNYKGFNVISTDVIKKGSKRYQKIQGIILTKKSIKEKYEDGYEKYKKYKDDSKKHKKYKEYKDDYETYKELKKRYENAGIWSDKHI